MSDLGDALELLHEPGFRRWPHRPRSTAAFPGNAGRRAVLLMSGTLSNQRLVELTPTLHPVSTTL
jgi:hypothetical protein